MSRCALCLALLTAACGSNSSPDPGGSADASTPGADAVVVDAMPTPDATPLPGGTVLWSASFGGTGYDRITDLAVDPTGAIMTSGLFEGTVSVGGGDLEGQNRDGFVARYDGDGAHLWSHRVGGASADVCRWGDVDAQGNWVVGCVFFSTIQVGSTTLISGGAMDVAVIKFSPAGDPVWVTQFGGSGNEIPVDIAIDSEGNAIAVGLFDDSANFGAITLNAAGEDDIYTVKLDSAGEVVWARSFGGVDDDEPFAVAVDSGDNIHVAGGFRGSATFNGTTLTSADQLDIVLFEYDALGAPVGATSFGGDGNDRGAQLDIDSADRLLLSGSFADSVNFGGDLLMTAGADDGFVAEFAADGSHLWSSRFGGRGDDGAHAIYGANGHVAFHLYFADDIILDGQTLPHRGVLDIALGRLDDNRDVVWSKHIGGQGEDRLFGLAIVDSDLVAGGFHGGVEDLGLTSAGGRDVLLMRLAL